MCVGLSRVDRLLRWGAPLFLALPLKLCWPQRLSFFESFVAKWVQQVSCGVEVCWWAPIWWEADITSCTSVSLKGWLKWLWWHHLTTEPLKNISSTMHTYFKPWNLKRTHTEHTTFSNLWMISEKHKHQWVVGKWNEAHSYSSSVVSLDVQSSCLQSFLFF